MKKILVLLIFLVSFADTSFSTTATIDILEGEISVDANIMTVPVDFTVEDSFPDQVVEYDKCSFSSLALKQDTWTWGHFDTGQFVSRVWSSDEVGARSNMGGDNIDIQNNDSHEVTLVDLESLPDGRYVFEPWIRDEIAYTCIYREDWENGIITEAEEYYHEYVNYIAVDSWNFFVCGSTLTSAPCCTDSDGDTFATEGGSCGPIDCQDDVNTQLLASEIHPEATENCFDGLDNNCNGLIDLDDTACDPSQDYIKENYPEDPCLEF